MDGGRRRLRRAALAATVSLVALVASGVSGAAQERPRARELGVMIGSLPTGPYNAITDVGDVRVGHHTVIEGESIRTGVTAILPHGGNLYSEPVRAAIAVGNGFGKLVGLSQVNELGEIETPILLTGTLSVFRAADALIDTLLSIPENRDVRSINPVVGETNDGKLSDIRVRPIRPEHVRAALRGAYGGPVSEGAVGAGTGTCALGWKGGIGTASRSVATEAGRHTLGVLVQTNYGGSLRIDGVPVGEELGESSEAVCESAERSRGSEALRRAERSPAEGGSVMIVVATDAPLAHRELQRVAKRTFLGVGRTGSHMGHGSGDYAIAFSTSRAEPLRDGELLSALFRATVEATEEAVLNSLFRATTVTGHRGCRCVALPLDRVVEILQRHRALEGPPGASPGTTSTGGR